MSVLRSPIDRRWRLAPCVLFTVLSMGACGGDDGVSPEVIEETDFAASLGVDLSAMTLTSSGLYQQDLTVGSGDAAVSGDAVIVTFTGWLANGSTFDAGSFSVTLGAGQVIAGFDQGVTGMQVGGTRLIVIPPALAYGNRGAGSIPPGSILIFRITLDAII